jgi:DNA (cytosine-5)-methyltransferase 1
MMTPTANSYFSGMGLMDMGLMQAGVHVQQSVDLDIDAINSMKLNSHYFQHDIIHRDIATMTVMDQPESDMMVMTYPCKKYSPVADIHGARTGEELYLHALRHIALRLPEMYVAENVPGMRKFKVVMETMTNLPQYYVNVFCPVETTNWLPQKRDRLILIGTRKPFFIQPPANTRRIALRDIVESNPEIDIPDYVWNRYHGKTCRDKPIVVDPERGDIAPTVVAHYSKDRGTRMVKDPKSKYGVRPFTVREYARLQGVPEDIKFTGSLSDYKLIGNGVPVPMGRWIGQQAMRYFN